MRGNFPDSTIKLKEGRGGIFEVKCNGRLIYAKHATPERRFPENGEISRLIEQQKD